MKRKTIGLLMVLVSGVVFGLMPILKKGCVSGGANGALLLMSRFFFLSLVMLPLALRDGNLLRAFRENWKTILLLVISEGPTPLLLYVAYDHLATGLVMTIHYLYPMVVVMWCALVYREKISRNKAICLTLSLVGVFLTVDLSSDGISLFGVTLALLSAVTYAAYIVWLEKKETTSLTSAQLAFFLGVGCFLIALVYALVIGTPANLPQVTAQGWLSLVGAGLLIGIGGSFLFMVGARRVDAQTAAISSTLEPLTSIIVGVCFMAEPMNLRIAIGCILILSAVTLMPIFTAKDEAGAMKENA